VVLCCVPSSKPTLSSCGQSVRYRSQLIAVGHRGSLLQSRTRDHTAFTVHFLTRILAYCSDAMGRREKAAKVSVEDSRLCFTDPVSPVFHTALRTRLMPGGAPTPDLLSQSKAPKPPNNSRNLTLQVGLCNFDQSALCRALYGFLAVAGFLPTESRIRLVPSRHSR
jgi:hypothetical protein